MRTEHRIEAIALKEIGVFKDLTIYFDFIEHLNNQAEIHILTGENGFGKSTILYALAGIFQPDFNNETNAIRKRFINVETSRVEYLFSSNEKANIYAVKKPKFDVNNFSFSCDHLKNNQIQTIGYVGFFDSNVINSQYRSKIGNYKNTLDQFDFAVFSYSGSRTINNNTKIDSIKDLDKSPFENALTFNFSAENTKNLLQWVANQKTKSALAKDDGDIEEAESYLFALNKIKKLIKAICDLDIDFKIQRKPTIDVLIQIDNKSIPFDLLPDGLKSILSWVIDLANRLDRIPWRNPNEDIFSQPIILFLDEIDIHLHPKWQRKILPAVQKLLTNAQIFVSTHSPFVVGSVEHARVYKLPNPNQSEIKELHGEITQLGHSYDYVLTDTFELSESFDIYTESLFNEFKSLRKTVLSQKDETSIQLIKAKIKALYNLNSEEINAIISTEIRQIERLTGLKLNDAE